METEPVRRGLRSAEGLALALVLAIAAGVRAIAWSRTAVLFNDGPIFLALADALRAGRFDDVLAHPQHPLYPALIALTTPLASSAEGAAVAISIGGGVLAVAALFGLAWRRFGAAVAWPVAWVAALHPWAIDFSSDVLSDGLYMGLALASFLALVELVERPGVLRAGLFATLAGLAYLARPEGLGLVLAGILVLAFESVRRPERRRDALRVALVVGVASGLWVGGLWLAETRAAGEFALSQKKSVAQLARGGPSPEEVARDRAERRALRADPEALPLPEGSIRADRPGSERPPRTVAGLLEAIGRVLRTSLAAFRYELFAFALIGFGAARGRLRTVEARPFVQALAATILVQTSLLVLLVWGAGYVSRRHALVAWLPLIVVAVLGWQALVDGGRERFAATALGRAIRGRARVLPRAVQTRAPLFLLIGVLAASWGPRDLRARRSDRALERVAAEWLRARPDGEGPVAAQKRRTAYYAGAPFVPIPDGRDGLIERQLRGRGARWLIIDADKLEDHVGLAEGLDHWLVPVHRERAGAQEILVLELSSAPAD